MSSCYGIEWHFFQIFLPKSRTIQEALIKRTGSKLDRILPSWNPKGNCQWCVDSVVSIQSSSRSTYYAPLLYLNTQSWWSKINNSHLWPPIDPISRLSHYYHSGTPTTPLVWPITCSIIVRFPWNFYTSFFTHTASF